MLEEAEDAPPIDEKRAARLVEAFAQGTGSGLVRLGAAELGQVLPPALGWWRGFASRYVVSLCLQSPATIGGASSSSVVPDVPAPTDGELASLVLTGPMMPGAEYLTPDVLRALWAEIGRAFATSLSAAKTDLQGFLKRLNPALESGRTRAFQSGGKPPRSGIAVRIYGDLHNAALGACQGPASTARSGLARICGSGEQNKLLSLLVPVQRAAEKCAWLKPMVDAGEVFHPMRWTPQEASRFLSSVPELESAGVVVRMPTSWRANRPPRPQVTGVVGARTPSAVGLDGLLDFHMAMTLDGDPLTEQEISTLLAGTDTLVLMRGQWVEVDRERLERAMRQFREAEELAEQEGLTFAEAMRLLAGASLTGNDVDAAVADWSRMSAGPWLAETLQALRAPDGAGTDPGPALNGTLRPYQKAGVQWMHLLSGLGLGACLADDMGLGKTIQVLTLLLVQSQKTKGKGSQPSLLVAPASLLANWAGEINKFAPSLTAMIAHPSAMTADQLKQFTPDQAARFDLAITSYGSLLRMPALAQTAWRFVILDEAQAIKNPNAKQTKAAKALQAKARIALTGTPVENHLGDLWSIFDFINPGLLGTAKQFASYTKGLAERQHDPYGALRELVRPYILRRMKTDKSVIADLPDKTEIKAYCNLSRKQAALYTQTVEDLARSLEEATGIRRKGIVLATLMRLKQICNHPSQWLNDGAWAEEDSGKWARLREIAEVVAARQEKMLVFTQFREMTAPLAIFLGDIYRRPGLVLHGETAVKSRKTLVQTFQEDEAVPFFILSLKAGGAGLTLTAASHVVHVDRWWNPAVENQATDRTFRIGQKKTSWCINSSAVARWRKRLTH